MFFFKKKKLIEIGDKLDSVLEQISICNQKQGDIRVSIDRIEKRLDFIEERIADISKKQEVSMAALGESISHSCELLQQRISDQGITSQDKMGTMTKELDHKLEMMDSSLRLLLLNSVMDQIEE